MNDLTAHPILLFDGVCNLCNSSVQFIIRRDPAGVFRFASLQSETAREMLAGSDKKIQALSTVILYEHGKWRLKSDAALHIVRRLPGLWPLLYVFILIPRPLRDAVYDWVARNRYRWFGKKEQCMIPRPEWRGRFIG
ncbi:MAG: thiol-disulfide oxidoreductase DCC family protein [Phaeodactylibacter sp.]|nr:thiol-disulfide oxidoreductase DCC family protein [Phaeodactylibacter sp.]MCB9275477.1 thiol-disulfide oxidoreductase DCC family protein [Lewinellaceae bacterium]